MQKQNAPKHRFKVFLEYTAVALAAISFGFLGATVYNSELRAGTPPPIDLPCDIGLIGEPCTFTTTTANGPRDILTKSWIFSEAVPWWISFFIVTGAGVAVIMLMVGGILILSAGGETERRTKGIKAIIWALIGLLICMFAFVAVSIIENLPLPGTT